MTLTAAAVEAAFFASLFDADEVRRHPITNAVKVEGIVTNVGFHPGRLAKQEDAVKAFIADLNPTFMADVGGGWSFLNLCMTKDDVHWGEQKQCEMLMLLAIGLGYAYMPIADRKMWAVLPGGVPYVAFTREKSAKGLENSLTA